LRQLRLLRNFLRWLRTLRALHCVETSLYGSTLGHCFSELYLFKESKTGMALVLSIYRPRRLVLRNEQHYCRAFASSVKLCSLSFQLFSL